MIWTLWRDAVGTYFWRKLSGHSSGTPETDTMVYVNPSAIEVRKSFSNHEAYRRAAPFVFFGKDSAKNVVRSFGPKKSMEHDAYLKYKREHGNLHDDELQHDPMDVQGRNSGRMVRELLLREVDILRKLRARHGGALGRDQDEWYL